MRTGLRVAILRSNYSCVFFLLLSFFVILFECHRSFFSFFLNWYVSVVEKGTGKGRTERKKILNVGRKNLCNCNHMHICICACGHSSTSTMLIQEHDEARVCVLEKEVMKRSLKRKLLKKKRENVLLDFFDDICLRQCVCTFFLPLPFFSYYALGFSGGPPWEGY